MIMSKWVHVKILLAICETKHLVVIISKGMGKLARCTYFLLPS